MIEMVKEKLGNETKYSKYYLLIIEKAKSENRKKLNKDNENYVYYEIHHILPASIFPEYKDLKVNSWNGVLLTYREHILIHCLIYKHYKKLNLKYLYSKMAYAFHIMLCKNKSKYFKSKLYVNMKIDSLASTYYIYNQCDKIVMICDNMNFQDFLKINNLPSQLQNSYLKKGRPIYVSYDGASELTAFKRGFGDYIGWYCLKDNDSRDSLYDDPFTYLMHLEDINIKGRQNRSEKMDDDESKKLRIKRMKESFKNKTQKEKDIINNKKKNFVMCKKINSDEILRVTKEEFDNRNDLVGVSKGEVGIFQKINIYDDTGCLRFTSDCGFKDFCDKHNIPALALAKSYRNNGKPLYMNIDKGTEKRLTENGNINFKGWYAIKED